MYVLYLRTYTFYNYKGEYMYIQYITHTMYVHMYVCTYVRVYVDACIHGHTVQCMYSTRGQHIHWVYCGQEGVPVLTMT